jgi:succinoglycan biosynthesis protein ExoA
MRRVSTIDRPKPRYGERSPPRGFAHSAYSPPSLRATSEEVGRGSRVEKISLLIPMLNEAQHVESLAADVDGQTFVGELEMIVADGGSTDGSAPLLRDACLRRGIPLTVIDNPHGSVSHALNLCLRRATGELIVRLDCHTRYPADYLERLASTSAATDAWNVGAVVEVEGESTTERAVACALDNPFGGANWSRQSTATAPVEVDTVSFGAFRKIAFERAGTFDEDLVRNQDDEFNLRLRRAGGRVVLDPSIRVRYRPRGSFRSLARQYYEYGYWKVVVMAKHRRVLSARSLLPIGLVASLALLGLAAPLSQLARWLLVGEVLAYASLAIVFGARGIARRRESWSLLPLVLVAFPVCHLSYGFGMLRGVTRAATGSAQRFRFLKGELDAQKS